VPGTPAPPLVPLDACNFVPAFFRPGNGEKFWDILFVARAVFFKGIPEFFGAIRKLYDQGHRLRVFFLCPIPPEGDAGLRKKFEEMFSPDERQRFTFLTIAFDYPFPFDMHSLAHFYGASRIFVHSAPDERRCRVAAYAWAAGMPVVGMACVGSILSPQLRRPPYFFETAGYADFPEQILKALAASGATDMAAHDEVSTSATVTTLRKDLEAIFGADCLSPLPVPEADLDIRMGRHHGLAVGKNRVNQDIGAFIRQLLTVGDADLARIATMADPELELARLMPVEPRKVPVQLKDHYNRFRNTALFKRLRKLIKGR
jgi:hypothetical protein